MREIAFENEQQDLVTDVEQIGAAGSDRVGDKRPVDRTLMGAYVGWHDRARWLKAGVLLPQGESKFIEDVYELTEVGFLPVAARSFALFDDRVDGHLCGPGIRNRDELGPAKLLLRGLCARRSAKQPLLAVALHQLA